MTYETHSNSPNRVKILGVCSNLDTKCMDGFGIMRARASIIEKLLRPTMYYMAILQPSVLVRS